MKKLFLAICFSLIVSGTANAGIKEILDMKMVPQPKPQQISQEPPRPKEMTADELANMLKERLDKVVIQDPSQVKNNTIFVEPSDEAKEARKNKEKGFFEKIYDNAMQRATSDSVPQRNDINTQAQSAETIAQQRRDWAVPDFPVINVMLPPDNTSELVPAKEHIPYFMSEIQILTNGMIKFDETIVVIANGDKLRSGLSKPLPRVIKDKNGQEHLLEYSILNVSANGQDLKYRIIEQNGMRMLIPEEDYFLQPGVYTYKLSYIVDNALLDYKDFREFYWNITGSSWNLVISKIAAKITYPAGFPVLRTNVYVGYPDNLNSTDVLLVDEASDTLGYALTRPLFIGEGFHIVMSLPEESITPLGGVDKMFKLISDNGDILFSLLALLAILISFMVSWRYIRKNKGITRMNLRKNGVMVRYLDKNRFDLTSLGCFVLELFKKNIIDIQRSEQTILLIKKTDTLNSLSSNEQKALKQLFGSDAVLNAGRQNLLKFKRAAKYIEKDIKSRLRNYILKMNAGYLFFSIAMLLFAEISISALYGSFSTFGYMILATLGMLAGCLIFNYKSPKSWLNVIWKIAGFILAIISTLMMSGIIAPLAAFLILCAVIIINIYMDIYSRRTGLLQIQINEARNLRLQLLQQREHLMIGKGIVSQQEYILALGLCDELKPTDDTNEYCKLDTVTALLDSFKS